MLVVKPMELTLARQTEEGARTLVWGALAGEGEDDDPSLRDTLRGAYTSDCKVSEPSDFLFSQEGKECEPKIWVCFILSKLFRC
jgi:retinol dehydrogenase-12